MSTRRLTSFLAFFVCLGSPVFADTLMFVAQFDPTISATNNSWFYPLNWWIPTEGGLVPSGRVPLANETAIITGSADGGASGIRVFKLALTNDATVMNGTIATEWLELRNNSKLTDARVNVLTFLRVAGTNSTLNGSTLTVLSIGAGAFDPIAPETAATLNLDRGAVLYNAGLLTLKDGSVINTVGPPQSRFVNANRAVLASSGNTSIRGSDSNPLAIDNNSLIRVDDGTLEFDDGIDWQSTANAGEFRAANTNSLLRYASPMRVPIYVTDSFTGPGIHRFEAGAVIDGLAVVGANDPNYQVFQAGNLVVDDSVAGAGILQVVASPLQSASLTWNNGTLSVPEIDIYHGALMRIAGGPGTYRKLSGADLNNSGVCSLQSLEVSLAESASINNLADGTFEVQSDAVFSGGTIPEGGTFSNAGLFRKLSTGSVPFGTGTAPQGPDFNNSGVVEVLSGSLNLPGGISSGQFRTESGATLWFWGGAHLLKAGATFTGGGPVIVNHGIADSRWLVDGPISVTQLELGSGGTVAGAGKNSPAIIRIDSLVADSSGTLTNANVEVRNLGMLDEAWFVDSALLVLNEFTAKGTNCQLTGSALTIPAAASGRVTPQSANATANLNLGQGATLQIAGRLNLEDSSLIYGGGMPQSKVVIQAGGILSSTNSATIRGSTNSHLLIDATGTFQADSGTLAFEGGLDWLSNGGVARFDAASPTSLILFAANSQFPAAATLVFTGPGTNRFAANITANGMLQAGLNDAASQTLVPGNLELNNDLAGSGALRVLASTAQTGGCRWNSGRLSIAAVNIDAGGRFLITGDSANPRELSGCTINNSGLLLWPGQPIAGGRGAVLKNLPGGIIEINADAMLTFNNAFPRTGLINSGTVLKSAGAGTSSISADFTNLANLEIRAGTLSLDGSAAQLSGTTTVQEGAIFAASSYLVQGGVVSGTGTIDANVVNSGTFSPGTPIGVLSVAQSRDFDQEPSGVLQIEIGGAGPGAVNDQLVVGRNVLLAGDLNLVPVNGFIPQPGQTFHVLSGASLSGKFARILAPPIAGATWVARYTTTNATVTLAPEFSLSAPVVSAGIISLSFKSTTGLDYVVQACEDLSAPNWHTVGSFSGDGLVKTFLDPISSPSRFFRVLIQ